MAIETAMQFRSGTPDDAAEIMRVHRTAILSLGLATYGLAEVESWATGLVPEGYVKAMTEGGETFIVAAAADDGLAGFRSFKDDEVKGLYVAPACARRGVGGALLRQAEAAIAAAGHRRIRLDAALSGQAFYERHGYRVTERHSRKTRGGLVIPVVDMEKALAAP
jgi:putative acetyltransferase